VFCGAPPGVRTTLKARRTDGTAHGSKCAIIVNYCPDVGANFGGMSSELDQACQAVYAGDSKEQRDTAEQYLQQTFGGKLSPLMDALVATSSPYTTMYLVTLLLPAFKADFGDMPAQSRTTILEALLAKFIEVCQPNADPLMKYCRNTLLTTLCRMVKLTLDSANGESPIIDQCIAVVDRGLADASGPSSEAALALEVLSQVVYEAQLYDANKANQYMSFGMHRKASTSLRDGALRRIFQYAVGILRQVRDGNRKPADALLAALTSLLHHILTYDFMAIIVDETEDMYVTQYPSDWKDVLTEEVIQVVGWGHHSLPMPHCLNLLKAMIGLIGTRRSFFDDNEVKLQFLEYFMRQIVGVEGTSDGRLNQPEYCVALAEAIQRFSPPHGYRDLILCPSAQQWFTFAANFTLTMFGLPLSVSDGSSFAVTTALMQFWSRIVGSKRLALSDDPVPGEDIEAFVPSMVEAFVKNRLTDGDAEVDDDALDSINTQADLLPGILNLCPEQCVTAIVAGAQGIGAPRIASCQSPMIWLMYIAAGLVRHWFPNLKDDHAPGAAAFLEFASSCLSIYQQNSNRTDSAVENGVVYFLTQLQHMFSSVRLSSALTAVMMQVYGGKTELFQFILSSVGSNMVSSTLDPATIRSSIELIVDACKDLPSDQLMALQLNLPPVEQLPFSTHTATYRLRTQLSKALYTVRLPNPFTIEAFKQFMQPTEALMRSNNTDPLFVAGWLRDLRGYASATSHGQSAFCEFLDWVMERGEIFSAVAATPNLPPIITNSYLKFLLELVMPAMPSSRVNVPSMTHSSMGIYLFQFVAENLQQVLTNTVMTSQALVAVQNGASEGDVWHGALKPITTAMEICRRCVSGEFCPFGAMVLYGDNRFDMMVNGLLNMVKTVPPPYFKQFVKLGAALQYLLRTIHETSVLSPFAVLDVDCLLFLVARSLEVIADVDEKAVVTSHALNFLSFVGGLFPEVQRLRRGSPPSVHRNAPGQSTRQVKEAVAQKLQNVTTLWDDLVLGAMSVVTTQDRGLSPAASTVFPIFECDPGRWQNYRAHLINSYPPAKQPRVAELLDNLGGNVTTADSFFSNLVSFRMAIRQV
jgi:hypothetical protein